MTRATLLVALLAATALAGCTGGGGGGSATALGLLGTAEDAAQDISSQADWVSAFAAEWSNESLGQEFSSNSPELEAMVQGADEDPGDGEARAWAFLFRDSEGPIMVIVADDGEVLEADRIPAESDAYEDYGGAIPLTDIQVDSDEAAGIVSENHDDYDDLRQQEDAWVFMALAAEEEQEQPFWLVTVFVDDDGEEQEGDDRQHIFAIVDARTGEYQDFSSFGF